MIHPPRSALIIPLAAIITLSLLVSWRFFTYWLPEYQRLKLLQTTSPYLNSVYPQLSQTHLSFINLAQLTLSPDLTNQLSLNLSQANLALETLAQIPPPPPVKHPKSLASLEDLHQDLTLLLPELTRLHTTLDQQLELQFQALDYPVTTDLDPSLTPNQLSQKVQAALEGFTSIHHQITQPTPIYTTAFASASAQLESFSPANLAQTQSAVTALQAAHLNLLQSHLNNQQAIDTLTQTHRLLLSYQAWLQYLDSL